MGHDTPKPASGCHSGTQLITKRRRPTAMLVPAGWLDRKAAVRAARRLREIHDRAAGATASEILSRRDEGRR